MSILKKISNALKSNKKTILKIGCIVLLIVTTVTIIKLLWPILKVIIVLVVLGAICGGFTARR